MTPKHLNHRTRTDFFWEYTNITYFGEEGDATQLFRTPPRSLHRCQPMEVGTQRAALARLSGIPPAQHGRDDRF